MQKLMKTLFTIAMLFVAGCTPLIDRGVKKPVIYFYPQETTEVDIKLTLDGEFIATYPKYNDGWKIIAEPDGTLRSLDGTKSYYCLFWEGTLSYKPDFSTGFVVKGSETEVFLEDALAKLGLNERERNEFIIYWLPQMQNNAYNLISFQSQNYTDHALLDITPKPDTVIRVMMAWRALKESIDIEPQELDGLERKGFTVVEWGGAEYTS